jgi:hypothetical protein
MAASSQLWILGPALCNMTETDKATMKMTQPSSTLIRRLLPPLDPSA